MEVKIVIDYDVSKTIAFEDIEDEPDEEYTKRINTAVEANKPKLPGHTVEWSGWTEGD